MANRISKLKSIYFHRRDLIGYILGIIILGVLLFILILFTPSFFNSNGPDTSDSHLPQNIDLQGKNDIETFNLSDQQLYEKAKRYFEHFEYAEAIKILRHINTDDDKLAAKVLYSLARCSKNLEDFAAAHNYYIRVYERFPNCYLADDALAMSAGMLYMGECYKDALGVYLDYFKKYPHSDVDPDSIWISMKWCLMKFKRDGDVYRCQDEVISYEKFAKLTLMVTKELDSYSLLERFDFWEQYVEKFNPKRKVLLEYIRFLLVRENFLEADKHIKKLDKEYLSTATYLKISRFFRLRRYEQVVQQTEEWLKYYRNNASKFLLADCLYMRIFSMLNSSFDPAEIMDSLTQYFELSPRNAFKLIPKVYGKLSTQHYNLILRDDRKTYLSCLFLSQYNLDILDYEKAKIFLKESLAKLPIQNKSDIERGYQLMEILDIASGYYFTLPDEERRKLIIEQILILCEGVSPFTKKLLDKYKDKIDHEIQRLINMQSLEDVLKYNIHEPTYDHIEQDIYNAQRRDFSILFECLYNKRQWSDFLEILPLNRIDSLPFTQDKLDHNSLCYEFSKLLYLLYMQMGFCQETCTALFLHDMSFLNKLSIFSIFKKADLGPSMMPDNLSEYFQFNTKNIVVDAFNRPNVRNSERDIIGMYIYYYNET